MLRAAQRCTPRFGRVPWQGAQEARLASLSVPFRIFPDPHQQNTPSSFWPLSLLQAASGLAKGPGIPGTCGAEGCGGLEQSPNYGKQPRPLKQGLEMPELGQGRRRAGSVATDRDRESERCAGRPPVSGQRVPKVQPHGCRQELWTLPRTPAHGLPRDAGAPLTCCVQQGQGPRHRRPHPGEGHRSDVDQGGSAAPSPAPSLWGPPPSHLHSLPALPALVPHCTGAGG